MDGPGANQIFPNSATQTQLHASSQDRTLKLDAITFETTFLINGDHNQHSRSKGTLFALRS